MGGGYRVRRRTLPRRLGERRGHPRTSHPGAAPGALARRAHRAGQVRLHRDARRDRPGPAPHAVAQLTGSAFLAPGAEVLPRGTWGAGLTALAARGLLLSADYRHDAYADARVHGIGPSLEWYAGRWLLAARYRYIATRFDGVSSAANDHAGLLSIGYQYGLANIVRVFGFAGGQSFGEPSRDRIGSSGARGAGASWRHFVSPVQGFEAVYALENLSAGGTRHTYGLRLVRRW